MNALARPTRPDTVRRCGLATSLALLVMVGLITLPGRSHADDGEASRLFEGVQLNGEIAKDLPIVSPPLDRPRGVHDILDDLDASLAQPPLRFGLAPEVGLLALGGVGGGTDFDDAPVVGLRLQVMRQHQLPAGIEAFFRYAPLQAEEPVEASPSSSDPAPTRTVDANLYQFGLGVTPIRFTPSNGRFSLEPRLGVLITHLDGPSDATDVGGYFGGQMRTHLAENIKLELSVEGQYLGDNFGDGDADWAAVVSVLLKFTF